MGRRVVLLMASADLDALLVTGREGSVWCCTDPRPSQDEVRRLREEEELDAVFIDGEKSSEMNHAF